SSPGPYSPFYPNAERAMETDFQAGSLPPQAVARVIVGAIESPRPRTRYRVGKMAKIFIPLRRVLSDRSFGRRMKKLLKLPDRSRSSEPPALRFAGEGPAPPARPWPSARHETANR